MTRQKIIEQIQICRNAKCCDCQYHCEEDGYPECMESMMEGIGSYIIHELQQIDKLMAFCEKMKDWHYKKSQEHKQLDYFRLAQQEDALAGVYIRIMNELKGGGRDEEEN